MTNDLELEVIRIPTLCGDDVPALERLLSVADPFVATTIDTPNPYCLADYVQNAIHGGCEVRALLDRNLVSRAVALASGDVVDHGRLGSDTYRLAAACMSFLITAQVTIEPNIAFYEFASHDPEAASGQMKGWRVDDQIHPQAYLDVALGRANAIASIALREAQRLARDHLPESQQLQTRGC